MRTPSGAILWDFDGTLAERPGRWSGCVREVLDAHHPRLEIREDDLASVMRAFPWHVPDVAHPELSIPDAWWRHAETLLAGGYVRLGVPAEKAARLARLVRLRFLDPRSWQLFPEVRRVLTQLRAEGWRHVILSNHVPELPALVDRLGLGELVDATVTSAATGYEKPHVRAFEIGRDAAGRPERIWMVGDNLVADIHGAERCGIPAILVRAPPDTAAEVRRYAADLRGVQRFLSGDEARSRC